MDVLGTYIHTFIHIFYIIHCKNGHISKYIQTYIKDHHDNMQVMIGTVSLKTSQI